MYTTLLVLIVTAVLVACKVNDELCRLTGVECAGSQLLIIHRPMAWMSASIKLYNDSCLSSSILIKQIGIFT